MASFVRWQSLSSAFYRIIDPYNYPTPAERVCERTLLHEEIGVRSKRNKASGSSELPWLIHAAVKEVAQNGSESIHIDQKGIVTLNRVQRVKLYTS